MTTILIAKMIQKAFFVRKLLSSFQTKTLNALTYYIMYSDRQLGTQNNGVLPTEN